MGKARDADGNIWEIDAQGNPVRLIAPGRSAPNLMNPKMPFELQSAQGQAAAAPYEAPKAQADLTRTQQQIAAQPLQNESTAVNIQQGRKSIENTDFGNANTLRSSFNALPEVKNYSEALGALAGAMKAPKGPQGDLSVIYAFAKAQDPGSVVREGEMDMANSTASVIAQLKQTYKGFAAGHGLPPEVRTGLIEAARQKVAALRPLYDQQRVRFEALAKQNGFNPAEVVGAPLYEAVRPIEEQYIKANGGTPRSRDGIDAGSSQGGVASGPFREEYDPEYTAKLDALIRAGAPYGQAAALARQGRFNPPDQGEYGKAVSYAKQHPNYRMSLAEATRTVPTTMREQVAGSPAGAFASGALKAGTLGFADEIAGALSPGDYATNRDAFAGNQSILANEHPTADFLGNIAGGVPVGYGMAAGLSRVPGLSGSLFGTGETLANGQMANPILGNILSKQGIAGDAAFGVGYGAGSENENRLRGAGIGLAAGLGGGAAARGALATGASVVAPTGGKMRAAYDLGVRPSIGQRVGGPVNFIEEKMQSLPLVGDAIRGTRDRAVDQFQLGLHNDALRFIGDKLPKGTKPGFEANAHSQAAERSAYNQALSAMTAKADPEFGADLGELQRKVAALGNDAERFKTIWNQSVGRRFQSGRNVLSGDEYKAAESELGDHIRRLGKNPANMDLVDALSDAQNALRGSAFRHSSPEAAAALRDADSMHARLVRIEKASNNDAGEPGEFSPKSYAKQVRTEGGGVRNRNYLAGKALNSDLAAVGLRLGDKVSNSFTWDRAAVPLAAAGAGYINPAALAGFAGYGALNAPGVRNAVTELMAPRANPIFDRAADQIRQRARLAGMFGAPAAIAYYGQ